MLRLPSPRIAMYPSIYRFEVSIKCAMYQVSMSIGFLIWNNPGSRPSSLKTEKFQAGFELEANKMNVPDSMLPRNLNTQIRLHVLGYQISALEVTPVIIIRQLRRIDLIIVLLALRSWLHNVLVTDFIMQHHSIKCIDVLVAHQPSPNRFNNELLKSWTEETYAKPSFFR